MSDSEFMSSNDEIFDEAFDNDFIENISNDSDSDGEDNGGSSNKTLKLEERKGKYHCNLMAQITTVIQAAAA
ncbi:10004_t:CDS:2 [Rhizophagus irregularis]|nr:10004_t:CDS:2 [Rhizophagus irregularis]